MGNIRKMFRTNVYIFCLLLNNVVVSETKGGHVKPLYIGYSRAGDGRDYDYIVTPGSTGRPKETSGPPANGGNIVFPGPTGRPASIDPRNGSGRKNRNIMFPDPPGQETSGSRGPQATDGQDYIVNRPPSYGNSYGNGNGYGNGNCRTVC